MKLEPDATAAVSDWVELSARMRRNRRAAQQSELVEKLRDLAAQHKETSATIKAGEAKVAERLAELQDAEADVAQRQQQIEGMEAKLNSGEGLTSRDLVALQKDIDTARQSLGQAEDRELEAMDTLERTRSRVAQLKQEADRIAAEGAGLQAERKKTAASLDEEYARYESEQKTLLSRIPDDFRARADANLARGGVGAALINAGACGACGTSLSGRTASLVADAARGQVCECEECETPLVKP